MSMMDGFGDAVLGKLKNFSYGHHPSIVMWSNGEVVEEEDSSDLGLFGGIAKDLEPILSGDVPESFSSFKFDAMVSESHEAEATVTAFPVSSGFVVSDHVIKHNRRLTLKAVAVNMQNSTMWVASVQGLSVITGAIFNNPMIGSLGSAAGAIASAFETEDRIKSTYDLFNGFRASGQKLYISTILGPYLNCVVTGIKTTHDKMTSAMLSVEIQLQELQVIGDDALSEEARQAMESMYDYSEFGKMAATVGVGVLGGAPLPGLGPFGSSPTQQLSNLTDKLGKLSSPLSSIKGRIL